MNYQNGFGSLALHCLYLSLNKHLVGMYKEPQKKFVELNTDATLGVKEGKKKEKILIQTILSH